MAPIDAIERVPLLYGQPFADSSAIPSYFVSRAAARVRKVVLNGDGGDEVFAGYRRYWMARFSSAAAALPGAVFRTAGEKLAQGKRRSITGFAARALRATGSSEWNRYLTWTSDLLSDADIRSLFPDLSPNGTGPLRAAEVSTRGVDAFTKSDFRLILADDLLTKMDIATMANSLEARSPLLDIPLAELAWNLPEKWRINSRQTKPLLRAIAEKRLPREITSAPKRGFEVPVARWLATDLKPHVHDLLLSRDSRVGALGDPVKIQEFVRGRSNFAGNRAQTLWALLMLEIFLRAPQPAPAAALFT
jgi:asparagine synthase (glutamine-hydrolysing)